MINVTDSSWSGDFSYDYFKTILEVIKLNFEASLFSDVDYILSNIEKGKPKLIMRHDVDVSLKGTLRMAEIEKEYGIRSTYMVIANYNAITDWPLYDIEEETPRDILRKLIELHHEIGLHYVLGDDELNYNYQNKVIESKICAVREKLKKSIGAPIKSLSFHRPKCTQYKGPLMHCELVNAYSEELFLPGTGMYLTDSGGKWVDGEPLPKLENYGYRFLQLLIHPIWWGHKHASYNDRLREFKHAETQGLSSQEANNFCTALFATLPDQYKSTFLK